MATQASINAVATVFQNVYGRAPTTTSTGGESVGWANALDSGATPAQLATALGNGPEGAALVQLEYAGILGRTAPISGSELAAAQSQLGSIGLAAQRHGIAFSAEAQTDIAAVYQNVLGRAASATEVTNSEAALQNGATLAQLYSSARSSPELAANLGAAYQTAFGTAPSAAVVTFLQQQIGAGATFSNLSTALNTIAAAAGGGTGTGGNTGGGTGTPVTAQITSATQDPAGQGFVDVSGTGQPGASVSATVSFFGQTITSPFAVATVDSTGHWSATNAPGSAGPGAGTRVPNGTFTVTPVETVGTQTLNGNPTSITVGTGTVSIPDRFNPADSMIASASGSAAAPSPAATASTAASAASLVQLTSPATTGITPTLHNS